MNKKERDIVDTASLLEAYTAGEDRDVCWILQNNLKKARLIRAHPEESDAVLESLR